MKRLFRILLILSIASALVAQEIPKNAMLKSVVLPGWGELSYKSNSAYIFLGAELALWLGFAGLRYSSNIQNQDLINFTRIHAGLDQYPNDAQFWADLGNYTSYLDHKEEMLENRTPENIWDENYQWDWDSEENVVNYDVLFRKKELTYITSNFMITGMIVNRIASVVNVRYLKNTKLKLTAYAAPLSGGGYLEIGLHF